MFVEIFHRLFVFFFLPAAGWRGERTRSYCQDSSYRWHLRWGVPVNGVGFNASNMKFCRERILFWSFDTTSEGCLYGFVWRFWHWTEHLFPKWQLLKNGWRRFFEWENIFTKLDTSGDLVSDTSVYWGLDHKRYRCLGILGGCHHGVASTQLVLHLCRHMIHVWCWGQGGRVDPYGW